LKNLVVRQDEDDATLPDMTNILSATVDTETSGRTLVDDWWTQVTLKNTNIVNNDESRIIETPDEVSGDTNMRLLNN
jgi:hypothetical protein